MRIKNFYLKVIVIFVLIVLGTILLTDIIQKKDSDYNVFNINLKMELHNNDYLLIDFDDYSMSQDLSEDDYNFLVSLYDSDVRIEIYENGKVVYLAKGYFFQRDIGIIETFIYLDEIDSAFFFSYNDISYSILTPNLNYLLSSNIISSLDSDIYYKIYQYEFSEFYINVPFFKDTDIIIQADKVDSYELLEREDGYLKVRIYDDVRLKIIYPKEIFRGIE